MMAAFPIVLLLAVMLVNGWTDAPNAISTAVSSGALPFSRAVLLAAVFDFLGTLSMASLHPAVAETVRAVAVLGEGRQALPALEGTLAAIVLWAVGAWFFGIPTSESHALVAGLTGSCLALYGSAERVGAGAWGRVLAGLLLSTLLGLGAGRLFSSLFRTRGGNGFFRRGQIFSAALMAFFHGAQDGQKFLALLLLTDGALRNVPARSVSAAPPTLVLLCAGTIAAGTAMGGKRIIETVGSEMTALGTREGFSSDLGAGLCLLLCTLPGLPVSTTQTKVSAMFGAGRSGRNGRVFARIFLTWCATFPACLVLSYLLTRLFLLAYR